MKIDGKSIAQDIFQDLKQKVTLLKEKKITPHIAIIIVGDNPASASYVKRKQLKAEEIGAKVTILNYESRIKNQELLKVIKALNSDTNVHGIIIQRPLPEHIAINRINQAVLPIKDIDAFHGDTTFAMPLAKAVLLLLENIHHSGLDPESSGSQIKSEVTFKKWLKSKNIVVIGKGQTGGGPIIGLLKRGGIIPHIIDSETQDSAIITKHADIIISAVGREKVIQPTMVKKGVILVSVGQHKQNDGKFHGDYEEEAIANIASFYSPTPGGVGPVNVACLLQNLIQATMQQNIVDNN